MGFGAKYWTGWTTQTVKTIRAESTSSDKIFPIFCRFSCLTFSTPHWPWNGFPCSITLSALVFTCFSLDFLFTCGWACQEHFWSRFGQPHWPSGRWRTQRGGNFSWELCCFSKALLSPPLKSTSWWVFYINPDLVWLNHNYMCSSARWRFPVTPWIRVVLIGLTQRATRCGSLAQSSPFSSLFPGLFLSSGQGLTVPQSLFHLKEIQQSSPRCSKRRKGKWRTL